MADWKKAATGMSAARLIVTLLMAFGVISGSSFGFGLLVGSSAVVNPGEKAVKVSGGEYQGVVEPGIHLGVPMLDRYRVFDMRHNLFQRTGDDKISAVTSDNVNVDIDIEVLWDIRDGTSLGELYRGVARTQDELRQKIVAPTVEDAGRLCANSRTLESVVSTDRGEYKTCVKDRLQERLEQQGLVVFEVSVTNMDYPENLAERFRQEQEAELQREIARIEGEAAVVRAEERAEAIQLVRSELTEMYVQYYAIEAGLSNANTIYVVPSDGVSPEIAIEPSGARNATGTAVNETVNGTVNETVTNTAGDR